jgi:hypothetical protein
VVIVGKIDAQLLEATGKECSQSWSLDRQSSSAILVKSMSTAKSNKEAVDFSLTLVGHILLSPNFSTEMIMIMIMSWYVMSCSVLMYPKWTTKLLDFRI